MYGGFKVSVTLCEITRIVPFQLSGTRPFYGKHFYFVFVSKDSDAMHHKRGRQQASNSLQKLTRRAQPKCVLIVV